MTEVIAKNKAQARADLCKKYYDQKPCKNGHEKPIRYLASGNCIICAKESQQRRTAKMNIGKPPKRPNYLNNKDMLREVQASKDQGKMTDTFARMMVLLTKKYAQKYNFANYTYNDDMQGYALLTVTKSWDRFNPEKSNNPFAYYTQCIKNAFIQYIKAEAKQHKVKDNISIEQGLTPSWNAQLDHEMKQRLDREENKKQEKVK